LICGLSLQCAKDAKRWGNEKQAAGSFENDSNGNAKAIAHKHIKILLSEHKSFLQGV